MCQQLTDLLLKFIYFFITAESTLTAVQAGQVWMEWKFCGDRWGRQCR